MAKNHKVAVVTGSTGGIGEGLVRRLAADGFTVAVSGRRIAKGEEIVRNIADEGGTACFLPADMADAKACRRLIAAVGAVNVRGSFLCSHVAIPHFGKQDGGSIVN